jgi:hypothetical protein
MTSSAWYDTRASGSEVPQQVEGSLIKRRGLPANSSYHHEPKSEVAHRLRSVGNGVHAVKTQTCSAMKNLTRE